MSHKATNWAFKQDNLPHLEWRVLQLMADCDTRDQGCIFSKSYLQRRMGFCVETGHPHVSEQEIEAVLEKLEVLGLVARLAGEGRKHPLDQMDYILFVERFAEARRQKSLASAL